MSNPASKKSDQALLVVLSSPSGAGKTTLIQRLLKRNPDYKRSISVTTRPKRPSEKNNTDYRFVSQTEFRRIIGQQGFVEWAEVHGNLYGTPKNLVDQALKSGWTVLFSLDVQGALAVKKKYPGAILTFILPPSWKDLRKRLMKRNSDSRADLKLRLANARNELKSWIKYDFVVVNQDIRQTVERIESIIDAEKLRAFRYKPGRSPIVPFPEK